MRREVQPARHLMICHSCDRRPFRPHPESVHHKVFLQLVKTAARITPMIPRVKLALHQVCLVGRIFEALPRAPERIFLALHCSAHLLRKNLGTLTIHPRLRACQPRRALSAEPLRTLARNLDNTGIDIWTVIHSPFTMNRSQRLRSHKRRLIWQGASSLQNMMPLIPSLREGPYQARRPCQ